MVLEILCLKKFNGKSQPEIMTRVSSGNVQVVAEATGVVVTQEKSVV